MISAIPSPSGSEEIIKKFLKKLINVETYEDSIGNLVVHKSGTGKKVMLICGIDEDAIVALSQEKDKIYFNHLGNKKLYPGTLVSINASDGYICAKDDKIPLENQYIGMVSDDEVTPGTSGVIFSEYFEDDNYIKGSRIGKVCVINEMITLANNYTGELDLYIVFEVQSLFNHKGALVASNIINPEFTITFEEIESGDKDLLLIKAAKGYISPQNGESFFEKAELKPYADTDLEITASFVKNSVVSVVGVPVKFASYPSSYIYKEVKEKIEKLFEIIF